VSRRLGCRTRINEVWNKSTPILGKKKQILVPKELGLGRKMEYPPQGRRAWRQRRLLAKGVVSMGKNRTTKGKGRKVWVEAVEDRENCIGWEK